MKNPVIIDDPRFPIFDVKRILEVSGVYKVNIEETETSGFWPFRKRKVISTEEKFAFYVIHRRGSTVFRWTSDNYNSVDECVEVRCKFLEMLLKICVCSR